MTDNETIAEFMGAKFINDAPDEFPNGYYYWENGDWESIDEFKYDSDWQDLMPVWYKFNSLYKGINTQELQDTYKEYREEIGNTILHKGPTPSEACRLLAEAIRWYKTIKQ
jgi:hypothetical protein